MNEFIQLLQQLQQRHQFLNDEYDKLLRVLGRVVAGDIPTGCVQVDLANRCFSWSVPQSAAEQAAAMDVPPEGAESPVEQSPGADVPTESPSPPPPAPEDSRPGTI